MNTFNGGAGGGNALFAALARLITTPIVLFEELCGNTSMGNALFAALARLITTPIVLFEELCGNAERHPYSAANPNRGVAPLTCTTLIGIQNITNGTRGDLGQFSANARENCPARIGDRDATRKHLLEKTVSEIIGAVPED